MDDLTRKQRLDVLNAWINQYWFMNLVVMVISGAVVALSGLSAFSFVLGYFTVCLVYFFYKYEKKREKLGFKK